MSGSMDPARWDQNLSQTPVKDNLNVLILNNYVSNNFPKMVNFKGEEQDDLFFIQGRDTDIQYGCSTKFRGEFWTFGGRGAPYKNQVFRSIK